MEGNQTPLHKCLIYAATDTILGLSALNAQQHPVRQVKEVMPSEASQRKPIGAVPIAAVPIEADYYLGILPGCLMCFSAAQGAQPAWNPKEAGAKIVTV